jgi:acetamidase/formamidase
MQKMSFCQDRLATTTGNVDPFFARRLTTHMGLTPMEALVVCSAAADFKIAEVVDMPKYVVTMQIPLAILPPP